MESKEGRERGERREWEGGTEGGREERGREGGKFDGLTCHQKFLQINLHKLYDKNFQLTFFSVQFACMLVSFSEYKLITFTL